MKLVDVLQWVTGRDSSGGSPTRPKPAGGSVGNPACVWGNPGCEARGNEETGRTLSPEICIVVDSRITPTLRQRGKADALHLAEGSSPRSLAAVRWGHHRGLRKRHASTGRTWELGRSNTLLQEAGRKGAGVEMSQARQHGKSSCPCRERRKSECEVPEGEATNRSPREGMLEVLTERSTDGRSTGRTLAVREGGEVRHKRPAVGKVKSDSASGGWKHARDLSSQSMSPEGHQTVRAARRKRRPEWCSSGWVPVASGEALAGKWFLPRNRMSESFTYGSVGGVGYNLGGNSRGRPAPTRKRDAIAVSIVRSRHKVVGFADRQQLVEWAPLMRMPICGQPGMRLVQHDDRKTEANQKRENREL